MSEATFSVCQFFEDGSHEYVKRSVNVDDAAEAFSYYVGIGERWIGSIRRVIVTDGNDLVTLAWEFGEGIKKIGYAGVSTSESN